MVAVASVLPSLLISLTSPEVFLGAIDFAGSYPVLLLWGVAPPLMALRLRGFGPFRARSREVRRADPEDKTTRSPMYTRSAGPDLWLVFLACVSVAIFAFEAIPDFLSLISLL